ncbi:uncharacterized protein LOC102673266 [Apis dorsata]|uniref:uncharacterized protein LOC102673266 n=1 Tax=Apis dorsata TaxID=7462 RepID=UPI0003DF656E|nr:uncharacterized protein LOC102673266 [Apis dorsata]
MLNNRLTLITANTIIIRSFIDACSSNLAIHLYPRGGISFKWNYHKPVRDHSPSNDHVSLQILYIEYDCIESFLMGDGRYEKCRIMRELKEVKYSSENADHFIVSQRILIIYKSQQDCKHICMSNALIQVVLQ